MYESESYRNLGRNIDYWKTVREYVDLARTVNSMRYGGPLTIATSASALCPTLGVHSITVSDTMKRHVLELLQERFEQMAGSAMAQAGPAAVDISEACSV